MEDIRKVVRQENRKFDEEVSQHRMMWYVELTLYSSIASTLIGLLNLFVGWRHTS
jgi:hypothetical protein